MMQTWADFLDGLKSGAKVIPLKKKGNKGNEAKSSHKADFEARDGKRRHNHG
jgi:hypothetical protein